MSKNPFINALSAAAYISLLVSVIFYGSQLVTIPEPSVMIPITMLSLFVLSAALMGYFFVYQPVQLLIEGDKRGATKLFLTTVFAFACITGVMVLSWLLLSGVF
ncbi:MAG: hypothetical protein PHD04_00100 [Candidatus Pacebacteria bacterium]|nr:hypothetical protein [Candidatus Paceibacterota bacterium]